MSEAHRMEAAAKTVGDLLVGAPFFETPFLQRRYRWRPQKNWSAFANAVLRSAEQLDAGGSADASLNFIGAMVFQTREDGGLDILDGQQRLITICAALRAVVSLAQEHNEPMMERRLLNILRAGRAVGRKADQNRAPALRLRPSAADAADFERAIRSGPRGSGMSLIERDRDVSELAAIQSATVYCEARFKEYLRGSQDIDRLRLLEQALLERTQAVAIQLSPGANAFTVFEQLNNLGERLSKLDLIKNKLFSAARMQGASLEALEEVYIADWSVFDAPENLEFWGAGDVRGDAGRLHPRPDVFLRAYLSALDGQPAPYAELESRLARHIDDRGVPPLQMIRRIGRAAHAFLEVCDHRGSDRHASQIRALRLFGAAVADPLLLAMRQHFWDMDEAVSRILNAVEACLVRRYVCEETGGFDVFSRAGSIILQHYHRDPSDVADAVIAHLAARQRQTFWPNDAAFEDAWFRKVAYHPRRADKKKIFFHILERIDAKLRREASGASSDPRAPEWDTMWSPGEDGLTIEHIWPPGGKKAQSWKALPPKEQHRLHSFGNLLPVSFEMNQELGRAPWRVKREILKNSGTALAQDLLSRPEWRDEWTLEAIDQRSRLLFEHAKVIWPRP